MNEIIIRVCVCYDGHDVNPLPEYTHAKRKTVSHVSAAHYRWWLGYLPPITTTPGVVGVCV